MSNLTLRVGEYALLGWNSIRVTRGIERCPNDFTISMTERFPGEFDFIVSPGDPCEVWLDQDLVISGHVDLVIPSIGPGAHTITLTGRGRCADLVDCAAEWPGGQISAANALGVAERLCQPYQIKVTAEADPGGPIPQLILMLGETAFNIIERVCRFSALLPYEGVDGNLILARVGTKTTASGFQEGVNVQQAAITYRADQQYSEYMVVRMAMDSLQDMGDTGNIVAVVRNPNIKRHRRRIIVSEGGDAGSQIAQQRAHWECSRRYGRAASLHLTTDSWRDSAGALYAPNTQVALSLPTLKAVDKTWLISEVTYRFDDKGTTCDLVIMAPEAFLPAPILLQPTHADIPFLARP